MQKVCKSMKKLVKECKTKQNYAKLCIHISIRKSFLNYAKAYKTIACNTKIEMNSLVQVNLVGGDFL